jgi:repressor LexA
MTSQPERRGLTERQKKVLEGFRQLTASRGRPPSVRDLATHFRIQVSAAWRHLKVLSTKGYIESRDGAFAFPGGGGVPVPILGRVAAGSPREAIEEPDGWVNCPASLARGWDLFAVRVSGDSMTGAAILEDDVLVCEQAKSAREGEIVVAMMDGEVTVKRLGRHQGAPALLPANPVYRPIPLRGEVRLAGRVLAVYRTLKGS